MDFSSIFTYNSQFAQSLSIFFEFLIDEQPILTVTFIKFSQDILDNRYDQVYVGVSGHS